ncbi:MAG: citrate lyase acyl carrier protein [Clostridiales bacterium]|nr:citrate lyase acyl carrier protein [Clostridiales bacterium]
MEIKRPAIAGTLESSDCQVTVEAGDGIIDFELESSVINQYGNQIKRVALETLRNLDIDSVHIMIVDKGALDCTIKARIEGAVYRSLQQFDQLPWGGAIQ